MWPCISARPGKRKRPAPSITVAPSGTGVEAAGPTATILSPRTTTVWSGSTRSWSIGMTEAWTIATMESVGAGVGS
jgi:hypothetical protein